MGRKFTHTSRKELPSEKVEKAISAFKNPSKWPDWNRGAKSMLATKAETIEVGDHLAVFQVIKGGLIEKKWLVKSIRDGEKFFEVDLLSEGQTRNERPIAKGMKNLQLSITFLHEEDGGIEVHSSCEASPLLSIFSKQIRKFIKAQTEQYIFDLSNIE